MGGLGIDNPDDSITIANGEVRAARSLRDDLLAVLFPRGENLPSEMLQSAVRLKIRALVQGIEHQLTGQDGPSQSWDMLAAAGLLREKSLIEFALARLAEDRIKANLDLPGASQTLTQFPITLLGHENARIAAMARQLLHAGQLAGSGDRQLYRRLPSNDLHLLCWRIVAALQEDAGTETERFSTEATALLAAHDGETDPDFIARKLVFFLGPEHHAALVDPRKSGLHLYVAAMAQDYGLQADLLYRLIDGESSAALLLLIKGQRVPIENLPNLLVALRGGQNGSSELADAYGAIDPVEARAAVAAWAEETE